MEGERHRRISGTTLIRAESLTRSSGGRGTESPNLEGPEEEDEELDRGGRDAEAVTEVGEDLSIEDTRPQETLIVPDLQGDDGSRPPPPRPTQEEMTPPSVSHPINTQSRPSEPCWYCLMSLDPESSPETAKHLGEPDADAAAPSGGHRVNYQTDPRPHFGVACSSHSPCRPLWGSGGPCWGQRNQEAPDQTDTCPHCHLGLPADTLRWHEAKCLLFEGRRSSKKQN